MSSTTIEPGARRVRRTEEQKARRRRRVLGVSAVILVLAAVAAVAVYFVTARVTGNVQSRAFAAEWVSASSPVADGVGTCNTTVTGGELNVTISDVYPGGSCIVGGTVRTQNGNENGRVTGVTMPGLPTGWTAELVNGSCGATPSFASPAAVTVKITMTETATAGSGGAFAQGAGLTVTPSSLVGSPPSCPIYSGTA